MKVHFPFVQLFLCLILGSPIYGQELTQTLRGTILDKESQSPLPGTIIAIVSLDPPMAATSDAMGYYVIEGVPVGRQDIEISFLGYETVYLSSISVTSGKELVLNMELVESVQKMEAVVISAEEKVDKAEALNEFATVSARTFSVEETSRYAASAYDPARMALNYAGVSIGGAGEDLFNEIIIRGNSSAGVLWRLEGIPIANPNHFGEIGSSGGAVSMLSSTTLSNSDFYTGAFPSEFGNALSGVFDLSMRNGNDQQREYSFMIGGLGLEFGAEGPINKDKRSSYIVNYRYSTLGLMEAIGLNPAGDVLPTYQDLSFKLNFPTERAGTFALFGLGGDNLAANTPEADSLAWEESGDHEGFEERSAVGNLGLSHTISLDAKSYLKTIVLGSYEREISSDYHLRNDYTEIDDLDELTIVQSARMSSTYNRKMSAKNSLRAGIILGTQTFDFNSKQRVATDGPLETLFDNTASGESVQAFSQWKHRFNTRTALVAGGHYTRMLFNNKEALEPRLAFQWQLNNRSRISLSSGLHSKMEHLALYSFQGELQDGTPILAKDNLGLSKSLHNVVAYDFRINEHMRLKLEAYHQYLYDIPVSTDPNSTFSLLNAFSIWDLIALGEAEPNGTGTNQGVDMTLEKFFAQGSYYMLTASVYDSKYSLADGRSFNTRFNGNYQMNILGGKEFKLNREGKNRTLGLNARFVLSGGNRYTAINLPASIAAEDAVYQTDKPYTEQADDYYRLDIGMSYTVNRQKITHSIRLDVQNATNRDNIYSIGFNDDSLELEREFHPGMFPFFNYRLEF